MTRPVLVLLGAGGQLGQTFTALWPGTAINIDYELHSLDKSQLDISDSNAVTDLLTTLNPRVIVNAAAYTAVDAAEENQSLAFRINADAVANLAQWSKTNKTRLIHVSTDFVFAGDRNRAYTEQDQPAPINVYGASKLKGEHAIEQQSGSSVIIRASWLYSASKKNFLKTMLQLMNDRDRLTVVSDQIGTPTSCNTLARFIFDVIANIDAAGTFHCSDVGVASWYDFAVAIFEEAQTINLLEQSKIVSAEQIQAIATQQYPTPASRPVFSVLDTSRARQELGFAPGHWRQALRGVLEQLKKENWKPK